MRLRRKIADLANGEHRQQITQIGDADHAPRNHQGVEFVKGGATVERFFTLGLNLASTCARGQEMDANLKRRWIGFRNQVEAADNYRELNGRR